MYSAATQLVIGISLFFALFGKPAQQPAPQAKAQVVAECRTGYVVAENGSCVPQQQ